VDTRTFLHRGLAALQRQPHTAAVDRHEHRPVVFDLTVTHDVAQRPRPEVRRAAHVLYADHDRPDVQHQRILAAARSYGQESRLDAVGSERAPGAPGDHGARIDGDDRTRPAMITEWLNT
jgi:hypothetical protein